MKKQLLCASLLFAVLVSCKKENDPNAFQDFTEEGKTTLSTKQGGHKNPSYDLNVTLRGTSEGEDEEAPVGHLKFRQDPNPEKIIDLDIKLHNMIPNHEYLLQRAVDPINTVDGICSSTAWLTLGNGLIAQSVFTDNEGNAKEELWRDVSAVPSGSTFDIHFQIVDAVTNVVILSSDCLQYEVR